MTVKAQALFALIPEWLLFGEASDGAIRTYAVLARFADKDTKEAHPSVKTIAAKVGKSERTTQRLLRELESLGAIQTRRRFTPKGDPTSSVYVLMVTPPPVILDGTGGDTQTTTGGDAGGTQTRVSNKRESDVPREIRMAPVTDDTAFSQFWEIYPRKEGKGAAKEALRRALRSVPLAAILEGAQRYRDDPNRAPAFTAHPTTWLNQGRWDDDPLPSRNGGKPVPGRATYQIARELERRGM